MIDGVIVEPLKKICDERGAIYHMLRCDDPNFQKFGEIYFSKVNPNAIKGWHIHSEMTLNYAVVIGMIKLVLYDDRDGSPSKGEVQEIFIGDDNYARVTVPPLVWNGFKGISICPAIVANCSTLPHAKDEIKRCDPLINDIPYDWSLKHG